MWASKGLGAGLALLLLGGCDRTMGALDGISPAAGLAHRHNMAVQTVNPLAGQWLGPNPGGDGRRVAAVINEYRGAPPADG